MSNMNHPPDGDWVPLADARARAIVVPLVEDMLDGESDPPLHRVAAPATEAVLVVYRDEQRPGLLLADGSVVVLGWNQMFALNDAFREWRRLFVPVELDALGPARATLVLPQ